MADTKISALTAVSGAARTMLIPVVEDPSGTPVTKKMTITQLLSLDDGVRTTSTPLIDMSQTWNASGTTFTAIKFNIAATAAGASSLLFDLQVGGTSKFTIRHDGLVTAQNFASSSNGSVSAPSFVFSGRGANWGFYSAGATSVSLAMAGSNTHQLWTDGSLYLLGNNAAFALGATSDLLIVRDAANTLAQRNGTNAQTLRVYNTYTDASNYDHLSFSHSGGQAVISTFGAGTGASTSHLTIKAGGSRSILFNAGGSDKWSINSSGHFLAQADNTHDIGASGATRPRTGYFGTSLVAPIATLATGTITTSQPALNVTQTWNAGAVTFVADSQDITNTASASGSLLIDRKVGGSSLFAVRKDGSIFLNAAAPSTSVGGVGVHGPAGGSIHVGCINGNAYIGKSDTFGATALIGVSNGGVTVQSGGNFSFSSDATSFGTRDLLLLRDAANILALRNGTSANTFRIYNTYTDASNYERGGLGWIGSDMFLNTAKAGTGTARALILGTDGTARFQITATGNLIASTDATYDIGASGANRPRDIYIQQSIYFGFAVQGAAAGAYFQASVTGSYRFGTTQSRIKSPSDGVLSLFNAAETDFARLQLGGTTSSFPAIKRDSAGVKFVLADDSASAAVEALSYKSGTPSGGTAAVWKLGSLVTASVTPDTTRYIELDVAGTLYKVIVST